MGQEKNYGNNLCNLGAQNKFENIKTSVYSLSSSNATDKNNSNGNDIKIFYGNDFS